MLGTKEICALLLAGGIGAGSVVTVQQVRSPASEARATKPKAHHAVRGSPAQPGPALPECPAVGAPLLAPIITLPQEVPLGLEPITGPAIGYTSGPGITRGTSPVPEPSPVPGVPAPDTWVLLIAGFGFVGLALRRRPRPAAAE